MAFSPLLDRIKKHRWVIVSAVIFVLLAAGTFGALSRLGSPNNVAQSSSSPGPIRSSDGATNKTPTSGGGTGIGLNGSRVGLIGSVTSVRNLKGLSILLNQIDACEANSLSAYLAVTDSAGSVITGINKKDIRVYLDDAEVTDFTLQPVDTNRLPLSTVIAIDHSGSMAGQPLNLAKNAATTYINSSQPNDAAAVESFDTTVSVLAALTQDHAAVVQAINTIQRGGNTAIYDAVAQAVDQTLQCGRRAVVLLTDGTDNSSHTYALDSSIAHANERNVPIFVVGLHSGDFNPTVLNKISSTTGAEYFEAADPTQFAALYKRISEHLGGQYGVTLKINIAKTSGEHRLKVVSTVQGSPASSERSL